MKKLLELQDIKRHFDRGSDKLNILKGITFDIHEGEFVTIMGTSGSGKTTLLNSLGCLDRPSEGTYLLDGVDVGGLDRDALAALRNQKIGFVFQSYNLLPRTNALENVELPLYYTKNISAGQRREKAKTALEAVKLSDRTHHLPSELSGGQQQRVAIARALVNDPVMILADEATGNLDTRTSYDIMALMQDLNREQGKTIIFVTHEPDIAAFSSRTIVLRDGLVTSDLRNNNIRSAKQMLQQLDQA